MVARRQHLAISFHLGSILLLCSAATAALPGIQAQVPAQPQPSAKLYAATTLTPLPPGLTLPIKINHAYRAGSGKPGEAILGITTQRIPIGNRQYLKYGAHVIGTILTSTAADEQTGKPAVLTIRFTSLSYHNQTIPIATAAVAIANFTDVADTDIPVNANLGRSSVNLASMTNHQVGEDEVARTGWDGEVVDAHLKRVGFADQYGIYADPVPNATGTAAIPHALGVFSTTSTGLYGFGRGAALQSSGGEVRITSPHKLVLRDGDNLLLRVL